MQKFPSLAQLGNIPNCRVTVESQFFYDFFFFVLFIGSGLQGGDFFFFVPDIFKSSGCLYVLFSLGVDTTKKLPIAAFFLKAQAPFFFFFL